MGFDRTPRDQLSPTVNADEPAPARQAIEGFSPNALRRLGVVKNAPTTRRTVLDQHRREIVAIAKQHRARTISVFGSVARGDERASSDIDFLVEFEPNSSLLDLIRLEDALAVLLQQPVDVVSVGGLFDRDDDIRRDAVAL